MGHPIKRLTPPTASWGYQPRGGSGATCKEGRGGRGCGAVGTAPPVPKGLQLAGARTGSAPPPGHTHGPASAAAPGKSGGRGSNQ
eukprot:1366197-Alexandrium_andersonii.AAC.1